MAVSLASLRALSAARIRERDLQECLRQLCKTHRWKYYHTHRSQHSPAGFPDTVALPPLRTVYAELKREHEEPSEDQREWLWALAERGHEVYLWRPSHWLAGTIEMTLRHGPDRAAWR
jgi:hypothetical protein